LVIKLLAGPTASLRQTLTSGLQLAFNFQNIEASPLGPSENRAAYAVAIIIHWVVVPTILLIIFVYALTLPYRNSNRDVKKSAREGVLADNIKKSGTAGIFAGLILFVLFVVTRPSDTYQFSPEIPTYGLSLFGVITFIVGILLGFFTLEIVNALRRSSKLAFLVMILVSASATTTYCYFLFVAFRSTVVFVALGAMLGGLLKLMIDPGSWTLPE